MRRFIFLLSLFLMMTEIQAQNNTLEQRIRQIIADKKATIGVALIVNGQDTLTVNNETHYPMMSVFKLHQALAVAHWLEKQKLPLSTPVFIRPEQLRPNTYSPLRDKYPQGNLSLPVKELLAYTLQLSDNNACDILFDCMGGTATTDQFIRSLGIHDFQISATENDMHRDLNLCYCNWTTPLAAACLADQLVSRPLFDSCYQQFILQTMLTCQTGQDRLPRPLSGTPARIGHKTGTGDRNSKGEVIGFNDVGFILLPDGSRYTLAVFICNSSETDAINTQLIAEISEAVYQSVCP